MDCKERKETKAEQMRDEAARSKQLKHESAFKVVEACATIFSCDTPNCCRIFGSEKRLRFHKLSQVCGLSKTIFRKYRGTKIMTKGNNIKDCAVEMVMKDGFATVATVVSRKGNTLELPLNKRAKVHKLCNGDKVIRAPLSLGFVRTKIWSSRTRYSQRQLGFLKWAFNLGAKDDSKKLTAEKAAEIMTIVGTKEGEKRFPNEGYMKQTESGHAFFSRAEWIEKYEIKSFFSKTNSDAVKQVFKRK